MDEYDNQSLTTHTKKTKNKKEEHSRNFRRRTTHISDVSVVMKNDTLRKNVPRRKNGRMI